MAIKTVFKTISSDLRWRNGQIISILRLLPDKEFGINSGGKMYRVKFPDGMKHNVFEDEIDRQERLRHPVGCKSA